MSDTSPAVERAVEAAQKLAAEKPLRLGHLAFCLLEEDEGRPAVLIESLGTNLRDLRRSLSEQMPQSTPAPPVRQLFAAARDWSLRHRTDPTFTSDVFLMVVIQADPAFQNSLAAHGLSTEILQRQLLGRANEPVPEEPSEPASAASSLDPEPVTPHAEAARVVDANLNRAREALRVLDDYCRFVLDDRFLTERFKSFRHRVAELTGLLPANLLLTARDTIQDVGTSLTVAGEYERATAHGVAQANLKRLQEALRSAEEFGKVFAPEFARGLEQLRYESYTLERSVVRGTEARERLANALLYVLLSGDRCPHGLQQTIERAAAGGADVIQLREKSLGDRELLARAKAVRRWTREAGVLFVVNDRPDIARLAEADGVHLGQEDLSVRDAGRILGPDALIGVSTHDVQQLRQAVLDGADYLGVGPIFPSRTKSFDQFPGLDFLEAAREETSLPAFALGGIGLDTITAAVRAGAKRVAVSAAVAEAGDPEEAARSLKQALLVNH